MPTAIPFPYTCKETLKTEHLGWR